jgi:acyl-CoA thioesterase|tara:strand:+ start:735 stop:1601 length:867 start_codon:yes stop_codon:yes gene_type:complete
VTKKNALSPQHTFDRDISLSRNAASTDKGASYQVNISADWQVFVGPNGGYIAAIILNGMKTELAATAALPILQPRSVTYHFLSASVAGPATLEVQIEKLGRTLSSVTAKLFQNEKTIAIALATFGNARAAVEFSDLAIPEVISPEEVGQQNMMRKGVQGHVPFRDQFDQRVAIGPTPGDSSETARVGGWTRFNQPRRFDDLAIAAISDSWYPGLFTKKLDPPMHCPTVDHTVHFLANYPENAGLEEFLLVDFQTSTANNGYLVEDGCIWTAGGLLLARSRQLAIILPH